MPQLAEKITIVMIRTSVFHMEPLVTLPESNTSWTFVQPNQMDVAFHWSCVCFHFDQLWG